MGEPSRSKESVFDAVSDIYNYARLSYLDEPVDDLVRTAKLSSNSRILEIGTGTGKLTIALARRGLQVYGVELGKKLAETARNNLKDYRNVKIEVLDFDTWEFEPRSFDLAVSATAFHWLEENTRVGRIADALGESGMVAIIDTVHVDSEHDDFPRASQKCYTQWDEKSTGDYLHPTLKESIKTGFRRKQEFSEKFETALDKPYTQDVKFDSETYVKLLQTYSDIISMLETNRRGFLNCVRSLIENEFNNTITKSYLWQLYIARKK